MENILNKFEKQIKKIVKDWDKIPDEFKTNIKPNKYSNVKDLKEEGHTVVLLLDRQKPSIESDYDYDEERIGLNRFGEIIWGFDSGCSCPMPWDDNFPECYNVEKDWKQFSLKVKVTDLSEDKYQEGFDSKELEEDIKEQLNKVLSHD